MMLTDFGILAMGLDPRLHLIAAIAMVIQDSTSRKTDSWAVFMGEKLLPYLPWL